MTFTHVALESKYFLGPQCVFVWVYTVCTGFSPDSEDVHRLGPAQSLVWGGGLSLCLIGGRAVRLAIVQQWSGFCLHTARSVQTLKG